MSIDDETREKAVEREVPICSCEEAEMLRALLKRWIACYENGDPMGTIYGDTDEALSPDPRVELLPNGIRLTVRP